MKKVQMNISDIRFILCNLKILGEIVSTKKQYNRLQVQQRFDVENRRR